MTAPTITYGHGYLTDCYDIYNATGTADSGSTTTTVDAERTEGDDHWNGAYIYYLTGNNAGERRKITDFVSATDTITHAAFGSAVSAGDTYKLSEWMEQTAPTLSSTDLTVEIDDTFKLTGTATLATDYTYWEYELPSFMSTTIYTAYVVRYKTSIAATGLQAKVELVFTDLTTQTILDSSFSTTWTHSAGSITSAKNLTKVRLYAQADAACSGEYVLYDFLLCCKGNFTFPFVSGSVAAWFPAKTVALQIPGRDGDRLQRLGLRSGEVTVSGVMDTNTSWGTPDGEYLYYIMRDNDPWQWFTSDKINCKAIVAPDGFHIGQDSTEQAQRTYNLRLLTTNRSSLNETTWNDKQWFGK